jgi:uncharacterized paraquat-inducible protein A
MTERVLKCSSCGALWINLPAGEVIERSDACLRCGGTLEVEASPDVEREGPPERCQKPGAEPT